MVNPSQGHFTLPHSLYIIYIYRYFLQVLCVPKHGANCSLSVRCIQNQTMFECIVSGYYHWFSLRVREDGCWNINNSTHFLVTKSWHIIFSVSSTLECTLSRQNTETRQSKPNSYLLPGREMLEAEVEFEGWRICLSSLTSAFFVTFFDFRQEPF